MGNKAIAIDRQKQESEMAWDSKMVQRSAQDPNEEAFVTKRKESGEGKGGCEYSDTPVWMQALPC